MRLLAAVAVLVILGISGLLGYAYFGDMTADPQETRLPVQLDLGAPTPAAPVEAAASATGTGTGAPAAATSPAGSQAGQNELD